MSIPSAYSQYKADNDKIASWLGRAALNHGYPREGLTVEGGEEAAIKIREAKEAQRAVKAARNERKKANARQAKAKAKAEAQEKLEAHEKLNEMRSPDGNAKGVDDGRNDPSGGEREDMQVGGKQEARKLKHDGNNGHPTRTTKTVKFLSIGKAAILPVDILAGASPTAQTPKSKFTSAPATATLAVGRQMHDQIHPIPQSPTAAPQPAPNITPVMQARPAHYTLSPRQYVDIAKYVVAKAVQVPSELFKLLNRCIELRQHCAAQLAGEDPAADERHENFVSILSEIRALLLPNQVLVTLPKRRAASVKSDADNEDQISFENRLAALDTEGPDDDGFEDIALPEPAEGSGTASRDTFNVESPREALYNQGFMFFWGFRLTRDRNIALWKDYRAGRTNLTTAGVSTHLSLALLRATVCREVEEDMLPRFKRPEHSTPSDTIRHMFEWMAKELDPVNNVEKFGEQAAGLVGGFGAREFFQLDFLEIIQAAYRYEQAYQKGQSPPMAMKLHPGNSMEEVKTLTLKLVKLIHDMLSLGRYNTLKRPTDLDQEHGQCVDYRLDCEVMASLVTDWGRGYLSLFTILGFRILADIMTLIDGDEERITNDAKRINAEMAHSVDAFLERYTERFEDTDQKRWYLDRARNLSRNLHNFPLFVDGLAMVPKARSEPHPKRSVIFARHPAFCGMSVMRIQGDFLDFGMNLANCGMAITALAAMYTGISEFCETTDGLQALPSWPDLDYLVEAHEMPVGKSAKGSGHLDPVRHMRTYCDLIACPPQTLTAMTRIMGDVPLPESRSRGKAQRAHNGNGIALSGFANLFRRNGVLSRDAELSIDLEELVRLLQDARKRVHIPKKIMADIDKDGIPNRRRPKGGIVLMDLFEGLERLLETDMDSYSFDYVAFYMRFEPILAYLEESSSKAYATIGRRWDLVDPITVYDQRVMLTLFDMFMVMPSHIVNKNLPKRWDATIIRPFVDDLAGTFRRLLEDSNFPDQGLRDMRARKRYRQAPVASNEAFSSSGEHTPLS